MSGFLKKENKSSLRQISPRVTMLLRAATSGTEGGTPRDQQA